MYHNIYWMYPSLNAWLQAGGRRLLTLAQEMVRETPSLLTGEHWAQVRIFQQHVGWEGSPPGWLHMSSSDMSFCIFTIIPGSPAGSRCRGCVVEDTEAPV
ncbi:hypothetical protein DPEC_G00175020 [Dallia pectoralis]|uniref:Uncharacterized protein n=1 Tax=Dallia pectoralis TaxID=75939 RepID=A0ACC2GEP0_DALPE|nr:hypothetical protein DPEC_G00175020 [Dallia pectoralis]